MTKFEAHLPASVRVGVMTALAQIEALADWSDWVPLEEAAATAPLQPGVYIARADSAGPVVYVGMAGERRGRGIRGRLTIYSRGKGLVSGLGEAAMDRALADQSWLRDRLRDVEAGRPERASAWGKAALVRANLHLRWAVTDDRASALALETRVLSELAAENLWNRRL